MFNKMKRIFSRQNFVVNEAYFGELWVREEGTLSKYVGDFGLTGFSKKQKEALHELSSNIRKAHSQKITELQENIHDLSPDYKIEYRPTNWNGSDGDFVLIIKDSVVYPSLKNDKNTTTYRLETRAEAEKKAKQLIKLCEENS